MQKKKFNAMKIRQNWKPSSLLLACAIQPTKMSQNAMKSKRNIPHRFQMILPLCALLTAAAGAYAQTDPWTGVAGDNNWATAGNWNAGAPTTGETPAFGAQGEGGLTLNNNLTAGTSFLGLQFNAGAPAFILNGAAIASTGGLFDHSSSLETVNLSMAFASTHSLFATNGATMIIGGVISGAGGITMA